jgi:hypothetical protein
MAKARRLEVAKPVSFLSPSLLCKRNRFQVELFFKLKWIKQQHLRLKQFM